MSEVEQHVKDLFVEKSKLEGALYEIEAITRGLGEFNPTYEKIHRIASEALGVDD
ncbi:MAG: hypothetical protein GX072_13035 [Lysinibacillus sp.]|nr:hypothetical protein [Lysinibacillus sp.]